MEANQLRLTNDAVVLQLVVRTLTSFPNHFTSSKVTGLTVTFLFEPRGIANATVVLLFSMGAHEFGRAKRHEVVQIVHLDFFRSCGQNKWEEQKIHDDFRIP
jgi:hypothetical protein